MRGGRHEHEPRRLCAAGKRLSELERGREGVAVAARDMHDDVRRSLVEDLRPWCGAMVGDHRDGRRARLLGEARGEAGDVAGAAEQPALVARGARCGRPHAAPGRDRDRVVAPRLAMPARWSCCGRHPVPGGQERIGRQRHAARPRGPVQRGPVDVRSGDPQRADSLQQRRARGRVARRARRAREDRSPALVAALGARDLPEAATRTDLQQCVGALKQAPESGGEVDRLAKLARPVHAARRLPRGDPVAGRVRDERQRRRRQRDARDLLAERTEDRIHHRRVKRVRRVQAPMRDVARGQPLHELVDRAAVARDDGERRSVDGRDRGVRPEHRLELVGRELHAQHRAGLEILHEPPARRRGASASCSSKTPASVAATYSPRLWPMSAAGRRPQSSSCARARTRG